KQSLIVASCGLLVFAWFYSTGEPTSDAAGMMLPMTATARPNPPTLCARELLERDLVAPLRAYYPRERLFTRAMPVQTSIRVEFTQIGSEAKGELHLTRTRGAARVIPFRVDVTAQRVLLSPPGGATVEADDFVRSIGAERAVASSLDERPGDMPRAPSCDR